MQRRLPAFVPFYSAIPSTVGVPPLASASGADVLVAHNSHLAATRHLRRHLGTERLWHSTSYYGCVLPVGCYPCKDKPLGRACLPAGADRKLDSNRMAAKLAVLGLWWAPLALSQWRPRRPTNSGMDG